MLESRIKLGWWDVLGFATNLKRNKIWLPWTVRISPLSFLLLWASRIGCRQKGAELHSMPRSFSLGPKVSSRYSSKAQLSINLTNYTIPLYHLSSTVLIYLFNQPLERCIEIYQHPPGQLIAGVSLLSVSAIRQFHKTPREGPVCLSVGLFTCL